MGGNINLPASYSLEFSESDIKKGIEDLSSSLDLWIGDARTKTGSSPVMLCMLRGAIYFFSDLTRSLSQSVEIEFVKYNTYDSSSNSQIANSKLPELNFDIDLKGKAVIIVDDICESGRLLNIILKSCQDKGASLISSAVLIFRDIPKSTFNPNFKVFTVKHEEWFVGYGLDDKESYRNLPAVYKIKQ